MEEWNFHYRFVLMKDLWNIETVSIHAQIRFVCCFKLFMGNDQNSQNNKGKSCLGRSTQLKVGTW